MKNVVLFYGKVIVISLLLTMCARTVYAATPDGTDFPNGAADNSQCTTAGDPCITGSNVSGSCTDNGSGAGICSAAPNTAIVDPFAVGKCKPGNDICHVPVDIVTSRIPLSKDDINTFGINPVGIVKTAVMNWAGVVHPDGNFHMSLDRLSNQYSQEVQQASDLDLNPAQLQFIETHDTTEKKFCVTARLCVSDPTTGKLAGDFLTDTEFCTADDIPGLRERTEGNRRLASFTTGYVQPSQDYTLPNIKTKKLTALGCSAQASGQTLDETALSYQDANIFGKDQPVITRIIYTIEANMVHEISKIVQGVLETFFQSKFDVPARYVASAMNPWAGHNVALAGGIPDDSNLNPVAYADTNQKAALEKAGGWVNSMYRADAYAANYNAPQRDGKFTGQAYVLTMGQEHATADKYTYEEALDLAAMDFQACTLISANDQASSVPQAGCDRNWYGASATLNIGDVQAIQPNKPGIRNPQDAVDKRTTPPQCKNGKGNVSVGKGSGNTSLDAAINAAATWAQIPACVLQGVAEIEGATEEMAQKGCVPNQCGAAGPFQVSVGKDSCGSPTCDNCGPNWKGVKCNDETWALKLAGAPAGDPASSACDVGVAAKAAAAVIIGKSKGLNIPLPQTSTFDPANIVQQNSIIKSADAYYGVTTPIARAPLNGLSYGEYVYEKCLRSLDPSASYTHQTHSFH